MILSFQSFFFLLFFFLFFDSAELCSSLLAFPIMPLLFVDMDGLLCMLIFLYVWVWIDVTSKCLEMNRVRDKYFLSYDSLQMKLLTEVSLRKMILAYWLAFNVIENKDLFFGGKKESSHWLVIGLGI